jgi:hypothetical protein
LEEAPSKAELSSGDIYCQMGFWSYRARKRKAVIGNRDRVKVSEEC